MGLNRNTREILRDMDRSRQDKASGGQGFRKLPAMNFADTQEDEIALATAKTNQRTLAALMLVLGFTIFGANGIAGAASGQNDFAAHDAQLGRMDDNTWALFMGGFYDFEQSNQLMHKGKPLTTTREIDTTARRDILYPVYDELTQSDGSFDLGFAKKFKDWILTFRLKYDTARGKLGMSPKGQDVRDEFFEDYPHNLFPNLPEVPDSIPGKGKSDIGGALGLRYQRGNFSILGEAEAQSASGDSTYNNGHVTSGPGKGMNIGFRLLPKFTFNIADRFKMALAGVFSNQSGIGGDSTTTFTSGGLRLPFTISPREGLDVNLTPYGTFKDEAFKSPDGTFKNTGVTAGFSADVAIHPENSAHDVTIGAFAEHDFYKEGRPADTVGLFARWMLKFKPAAPKPSRPTVEETASPTPTPTPCPEVQQQTQIDLNAGQVDCDETISFTVPGRSSESYIKIVSGRAENITAEFKLTVIGDNPNVEVQTFVGDPITSQDVITGNTQTFRENNSEYVENLSITGRHGSMVRVKNNGKTPVKVKISVVCTTEDKEFEPVAESNNIAFSQPIGCETRDGYQITFGANQIITSVAEKDRWQGESGKDLLSKINNILQSSGLTLVNVNIHVKPGTIIINTKEKPSPEQKEDIPSQVSNAGIFQGDRIVVKKFSGDVSEIK